LDSAHSIEEKSTILVTDTFCVLTSVIRNTVNPVYYFHPAFSLYWGVEYFINGLPLI
jgi:hypothetical protein